MSIKNKRKYDLFITIIIFPFWLIIVSIITLLLFCSGHRPVFFSQMRVVSIGKEKRIFKFRSMNSQKVKRFIKTNNVIKQSQKGFMSIDPSSGVYTRIGKILESFKLVELPEIFYVLTGDLSIVGNRPLPAYLQDKLEENYPNSKKRLLTKAGILGVIQMVGRENFTPQERIKFEVQYSEYQFKNYSFKLDLIIIFLSILRIFKFKLIKNKNDIYMILKDKSFRNIGCLIKTKRIASKPAKQ